MYDLQFRSNVFDKDQYYNFKDVNGRVEFNYNEFSNMFPFDYFESTKKSFQVLDDNYIFSEKVTFEDTLEIVLPEYENNELKDRQLIYLMRIKSDSINAENDFSNYQLLEIPLTVNNGRITINQGCSIPNEDNSPITSASLKAKEYVWG